MKTCTPEISWHSCCALYSVDFCNSICKNIDSKDNQYYMMATGGADGMIGIWLISKKPILHKDSIIFLTYIEKHVGSVNVVRFSPCGNYLATGGDDSNLIIWKLNDQIHLNIEKIHKLDNNIDLWIVKNYMRGHIDSIYDISWSCDSLMLCTGSVDSTAILWNVNKGNYTHIFRDNKSYIQGVCLFNNLKIIQKNPKSKYILLIQCGDGTTKIYSIPSMKILYRISKYKDLSWFLNFNNNQSNKKTSTFQIFSDELHGSFYRRCSFSPDGKFFILTGGLLPILSSNKIENNKSSNSLKVAFLYNSIIPNLPIVYYIASSTSCIAVKFSPKIFSLRKNVENINPFTINLDYRMIFAILSLDALAIYDTQSMTPIGYVKNTHFSAHTDFSWFPNGYGILFSSTDGYVTICEFSEGEFGEELNINFSKILENTNDKLNDENKISNEIKLNDNDFVNKKITINISDNQPKDILNKGPIGISALLGRVDPKPKRVPFITISKKTNN